MFQITKKLARDVAAAIARLKFEKVGDGRIFVPDAKVYIGGVFSHRHAVAGGEYGPVQLDPNLVVNQGLNYVLNAAFLGQAQTTQFYVALFSNNYNPAAGLTGANFNATADEFMLILSAPALSSRRTSSSARTPPPTVSGMNTCEATASMMPSIRSRPSDVAVMSRKVISSAPCSS